MIDHLTVPLTGYGKTISARQNVDGPHVCLRRAQSSGSTGKYFRRMLKKAVQQVKQAEVEVKVERNKIFQSQPQPEP
jgi:hypothetical protein